MKTRKIIIFGAGRMGLSHAAMAGLIDSSLNTVFIEPDFKTRLIFRTFIGSDIKFKSQLDKKDISSATHAIIASPPKIHELNLDQLIKNDFKGKILIEKPICIDPSKFKNINNNIMSGYVLNHCYFFKVLLNDIVEEDIENISIVLETNQDFSTTNNNWRTENKRTGLSLFNEFGSHCINLLTSIVQVGNLQLIENKNNYIKIIGGEKITQSIELKANSINVRKSVYTITITTHERIYKTDFYSYKKRNRFSDLHSSTSLAKSGVHPKAYLRGEEFCQQMIDFLDDKKTHKNELRNAIKTDQLLDVLGGSFK